jgi:hypothetical protein
MNPMHPSWLRPDLRTPGVSAVMTTRQGGFSAGPFDSLNLRAGLGDDADAVARNQAVLAGAIGLQPVYLEQVHGRDVVRLSPHHGMSGVAPARADASFTTDIGVACAVQVADCLPVLMAVPGGVAAAHAGWRGLAGGVLEATLCALCDATGCAASEVVAWLGPCIGPRSFEVGDDVRLAFGSHDPSRFKAHAPGKWLADLPALAHDRLTAAGVVSISGGDWCTVEDASRFFSFRRDRLTGRMAAVIWRTA